MHNVTANTPAGSTVKGSFTVIRAVRENDGRVTQKRITLTDHHSVLLGVKGDMALLAYAGTDDDTANARRAGYIPFPRDNVDIAKRAGWSIGGRFFIDCSKVAWVPVAHLQVRGRLVNSLFNQVVAKAVGVKAEPLFWNARDEELVTGAKRVEKSKVC